MNATSSYEAVERAQRAVEQWKEVLEFATANLERAHRNLEAARRIGTQPALPQHAGAVPDETRDTTSASANCKLSGQMRPEFPIRSAKVIQR
jgi:hypothetical protein